MDDKAKNGDYNNNTQELMEDGTKIENRGKQDHKDLVDGKDTDYGQYSKELDKNENTKDYTNAYDQDRKDIKKKLDGQ
jgi:hypothetical protein